MKNLLLLPCFFIIIAMTAADNPVAGCRCKNTPLFGKVKVVDSYPDFKVKVVDAFPDLKVMTVERYADKCGEWQFVNEYPDFTVQFVDAFPDFKIQFVSHYPGINR